MAKPDWGALKDQFLADHAKTGISPKDWCEARGIKYSTAKRYIKIANSGANSQKRSANQNANKLVRKSPKTQSTQATDSDESFADSQSDEQEKQGLLKPQNIFAKRIREVDTEGTFGYYLSKHTRYCDNKNE